MNNLNLKFENCCENPDLCLSLKGISVPCFFYIECHECGGSLLIPASHLALVDLNGLSNKAQELRKKGILKIDPTLEIKETKYD